MRKDRLFVVALLLLSTTLFGQQPAGAKSKPSAAPQKAATSIKKTDTSDTPLPSKEVVDSFMKRMFGYNAGLTWKITDISASEMPGVSRVLVTVGEQSQSLLFYVMPGGKFAMVGDVIPFGADPFAPARNKLQAEARGPHRGAATAPVELVEFSDLQCPHCKVAQPIIDKLLAESPNAKLTFQAFPLPMHPWAMKAAEYADCVAQQKPEAFWTFINSVYDAQATITDADAENKFKELATASGTDAAKVSACSASADTKARIQKSIELGKEVDVNATPTLFINGRKVQSIANTPIEQLKAMIDYEVTQGVKK